MTALGSRTFGGLGGLLPWSFVLALAGCAEPYVPVRALPAAEPEPLPASSLLASHLSDTRRALAAKDYPNALRFAEVGLGRGRSKHLEASDEFLDLLIELSRASMGLGKLEHAELAMNEELELLAEHGAQNTERAAVAHQALGTIESRRDHFEIAERHMLTALSIREREQQVDPLRVTHSLRELASIYVTAMHLEQAIVATERGIAMLHPGQIDRDTRLAELYITLGEAHRYGKNNALAEAPFASAVECLSPYGAQRSEILIDALQRLAHTKQTLGKQREAIPLLEQALTWISRSGQLEATELRVVVQLLRAYSDAGQSQASRELAARYSLLQRSYWPRERRFENVPEIPDLESAPHHPVSQGALGPSAPAAPNESPANARERVAEVVGGLRAAFRDCYQVALARDRDLEGNIRLSIRIGSDGTVERASARVLGLAESDADCVLRIAGSAKFPASAAGSEIEVPVTFVRQ